MPTRLELINHLVKDKKISVLSKDIKEITFDYISTKLPDIYKPDEIRELVQQFVWKIQTFFKKDRYNFANMIRHHTAYFSQKFATKHEVPPINNQLYTL